MLSVEWQPLPMSGVRKVAATVALPLAAYVRALALPAQEPPPPHWPWWLRILAVIGALVFVVIVGRSMRGSGGQGPGANQGS